jgi:hypothetical protein
MLHNDTLVLSCPLDQHGKLPNQLPSKAINFTALNCITLSMNKNAFNHTGPQKVAM